MAAMATTRLSAAAATTSSRRGDGFDRFTFQNGFGNDVITDFQSAETDVIDLTGVSGVDDFATAQSLATQSGPDTVIDFGGGNVITMDGVLLSSLGTSDFVFGTP